ncbi:MAG: hypothetical protein NTW93_03250 [Phycisphaerae bacterium]|nr:hypothetical protein [Phycisphaerae bacterium]
MNLPFEIVIKRYVILAVFALAAAQLQAVTYYVDSVNGNDANSGTSQGNAWKTLAKVNTKTFAAGDSLLFKAGCSWTGTTQLHPLGSGSSGNPIIIDMYGDPNAGKPIINSGNTVGLNTGTVWLDNQSYWEINNLEITTDYTADNGERRGIYLGASTASTTFNHLYVRNCYIHHIKGLLSLSDSDTTAKRTGGILVEGRSSTTRFNDILIEDNTITTCRNQGIVAVKGTSSVYPGTTAWNAMKATNVIIRNNVISDITKNAMIIRNTDESCLVENNLLYNTATLDSGNTIFTASCRGTVFQYNEGYGNNAGPAPSDHDGSLYDADLRSPSIVFQYSYSHDNTQGLFWTYPSTDGANSNVLVRYNISRNDKGIIFAFSGDSGATASSYIYNNTVYIPNTATSQLLFDYRQATHTIYAYNNIFYILNTGASYDFSSMTKTFNYNVFYGVHPSGEPSDAHKLTSNPMLVNPGSGGIGLDTVDGYMLQAGSPCIDSGMTIAGNGGLDYWGNSVPYNSLTDRGAHEWAPIVSDTNAPTPNPMTWATTPHSTGPTSISMTATTATDISGVEYYFANTTIADHNSGWQSGATYTDTGLVSSTSYTYTVKARDLSENLNVTADSTPASATTAADTSPPQPNPMTWAVVPHQVSSNSISMTATTATDDSGVEYYFTSIADGEHDSGWQASSTYIDTGLNPGTYSYQVIAHDTSLAQNTGGWSSENFATLADINAPTPNPMTWATTPHSTGPTSIAMTATTATDISGVEYYFACTAGGGHDSGWQAGTTYTDTDLSPSTTYTYTVKARDLSTSNNETAASSPPASATTNAPPDTNAPSPNPMTWAIEPNATSGSSITMTATIATDISGIEYYFANTTITDHNSGWQAEPNYTDTDLSPSTSYTYTVKARDLSENHNETGWSPDANATTLKWSCTAPIASDIDGDCQVNFFDYAILSNVWAGDWLEILQFAEDWLTCNRNPAEECWQ